MAPNPSTCVACGRRFADNRELAAIPDANKIAFDPTHRRVWRICAVCGEWNLLGADASAAALPELDARFAANVPMGGTPEAFAPTRIGDRLELLRVGAIGEMGADDSLGVELRAEVDRRARMFRRLMILLGVGLAATLVVEAVALHGDIGSWMLTLSGWAQVAFLFALARRMGGGKASALSLAVKGALVLGLLALVGAVLGIEHIRYELAGFAFVTPFVLIGGPLYRRFYPVVRVSVASGTAIRLSRLAVTRVTLSWDQDTGVISLWDLPRGRSLSGGPAIVVFRRLLPWLVQADLRQLIAANAVTEKAYALLRAVGGLRGLLHALEGFRADNVGRVVIAELPAIYLVALDLALSEQVGQPAAGGELRQKALDASAVAREAEALDQGTE